MAQKVREKRNFTFPIRLGRLKKGGFVGRAFYNVFLPEGHRGAIHKEKGNSYCFKVSLTGILTKQL